MLFQVRYYQGEESEHDIGFGIAPGNMFAIQREIKEKLEQHKVDEGKYLSKGTLVEILHKPSGKIPLGDIEVKDWGHLCVRLISDSEKSMKIVAKELNLPFDKGAIVDYN